MAGAALTWIQALSDAVASNVSDLLAPLEALFTVERVGDGENAVRVPTSGTGLTMENITPGTVGGTDADYTLTGVNITPLPRSIQIPIAEDELRRAQDSQIADIIARMSEAAHKKIVGLLGTAIETRCAAAAQKVGVGAAQEFDMALVKEAKWKLKKNGAPGAPVAIVTPGAMEELETDLETKNTYSALTDTIVDGAQFFRYSGVLIYPDIHLGYETATPNIEHNLMSTKNGVRIVYGGTGPEVKILTTSDPVNVRLAMVVWVAVDIPEETLGMWMRCEV